MTPKYGAGGTAGGLLEFLIGGIMILAGGVLFFQRLLVTSSYHVMWGTSGSGFALIILLIGIGVLFFSGRSRIAWLLIAIGGLMIAFTVISNLVIYFAPTSLGATVVMLGLIFGGFGVMLRGLRPH